MYVIAAGLVLLGGICGATVRLPLFLLVLLGAAAIVAISVAMRGEGGIVLDTVLAVVALEVGYAGGIVARAVLRAWQKRRAAAECGRGVRLPSQQKHT